MKDNSRLTVSQKSKTTGQRENIVSKRLKTCRQYSL